MIDLKNMPREEIERRRTRSYWNRILVALYANRSEIVKENAKKLAAIDAAIARVEEESQSPVSAYDSHVHAYRRHKGRRY
jgi:hypothetical protein